jgi:hypothetical protein
MDRMDVVVKLTAFVVVPSFVTVLDVVGAG